METAFFSHLDPSRVAFCRPEEPQRMETQRNHLDARFTESRIQRKNRETRNREKKSEMPGERVEWGEREERTGGAEAEAPAAGGARGRGENNRERIRRMMFYLRRYQCRDIVLRCNSGGSRRETPQCQPRPRERRRARGSSRQGGQRARG